MLLRSVAAGLLGVAALTSVAFAEPPASLSESSLQGNWRASKVVGLRVYNDNNEDVTWDGVWDFASGCMATYRALAEKAAHFDALPEVKEALEAASTPELGRASVDGDEAEALKAESEALDALAERGYYNERLDQLVVEVLLGVR